jgi:hypothetical protein
MILKEGSIPNEVHAKGAHANGKMKRKAYEKELQKLQVEATSTLLERARSNMPSAPSATAPK